MYQWELSKPKRSNGKRILRSCRKFIKNRSCAKRKRKRRNAGEQDDGIFQSSAKLEQNAIPCIAKRLRAHRNGKDNRNDLADELLRRFRLYKRHHLHGENGGARHDQKAAYCERQIRKHARGRKAQRGGDRKDAYSAAGQERAGFSKRQSAGEDTGAYAACQSSRSQSALCIAVQPVCQICFKIENFRDQIRQCDKNHRGQT